MTRKKLEVKIIEATTKYSQIKEEYKEMKKNSYMLWSEDWDRIREDILKLERYINLILEYLELIEDNWNINIMEEFREELNKMEIEILEKRF